MKRKEKYCYKAGTAYNETELIQCITLKLSNLIRTEISHERQTNTNLIFSFHICICININLSNKGPKKFKINN